MTKTPTQDLMLSKIEATFLTTKEINQQRILINTPFLILSLKNLTLKKKRIGTAPRKIHGTSCNPGVSKYDVSDQGRQVYGFKAPSCTFGTAPKKFYMSENHKTPGVGVSIFFYFNVLSHIT